MRRWWGWGVEEGAFAAGDGFWPWLSTRLGGPWRECAPVALERVTLPPPREVVAGALPSIRIATDLRARLEHCAGKSTRDLIEVRRGRIARAPDAVVYPESGEHVAHVLRAAAAHQWAVVPFGGGSSVVGGVDPVAGPGQRAVITLDLTSMNRLLDLDHVSRRATFEAGAFGPHIEASLKEHGLTLGHYPQSFEHSTLGGWVATRSAGQFSTRYGKIERMVRAVHALTPRGEYRSFDDPASATGPDLREVIVGSEGVFGVILDATVRVRPAADRRHFESYLIDSFEEGIDAVRTILHAGLSPALVRLSDPQETEVGRMLGGGGGFGFTILRWFKPGAAKGAHLLLGTEESDPAAYREFKAACDIADDFSAAGAGSGPGRHWFEHRFSHPYLRDEMLNRGVFVETYETSAPWKRIKKVYADSRAALESAVRRFQHEPVVMCHLSHAYPDGASLYFSVMCLVRDGEELDLWDALKRTACDAFTHAGATVTHHHGVGTAHRAWVEREQGPLYAPSLRALKGVYDPTGILNPGKLIP